MGSEGSDHGHERTAVPLVPDDLPALGHLDGTAGLEDGQRGAEPAEQALPRRELVGGVAQGEVEVMGAVEEAQRRPPGRPVARSSSPSVARLARMAPTAAEASSTNTTEPAPRESASIPMAPLPANRSATDMLLEVDQAPEDVEDRLPHPVRRRAGGRAGRGPQEPATAAAGDHTHGRRLAARLPVPAAGSALEREGAVSS